MLICRWNEVQDKVAGAREQNAPFACVINWETPDAALDDGRTAILTCGTPQLILPAFDFEDVTDAGGPTLEQVASALAFVQQHARMGGRILLSCYAGVARSTALAFGILAQRRGPGDESAALDQLLAIRPQAAPNILIVRYLDQLLNRAGALEAVILSHAAVTERRAQAAAARREWRASLGHGR